jgi:enoyl-CoA hydratase
MPDPTSVPGPELTDLRLERPADGVRLGMHAGMAASYLLPEVVGDAHARELLRTGRTVGAEEALRLTKVALQGGHADFESALQWEALAQPVTLATEDLQEGIRAAREKRAPRFQGR